jgi:hypothetical protein
MTRMTRFTFYKSQVYQCNQGVAFSGFGVRNGFGLLVSSLEGMGEALTNGVGVDIDFKIDIGFRYCFIDARNLFQHPSKHSPQHSYPCLHSPHPISTPAWPSCKPLFPLSL